ncbi:hypothetical protein ANCCEY_14412 [Ancylostoma ceylanicum]|uniref:G-protein coupled receptors family 1 profile domain-containing protein n=1 Tax=Ancylostoma ceylanicum TaxID=53326 RepID=A0A0D6LFQ6_9BILA|nr:hypothetical protein ANCCEY_14412 [Ancylostoma ceylanicum]
MHIAANSNVLKGSPGYLLPTERALEHTNMGHIPNPEEILKYLPLIYNDFKNPKSVRSTSSARHFRLGVGICDDSEASNVVPNGNCTGVTSLTAIVSEFSEKEPYKSVYKFWFRSIITIVLPFILCFYLNFGIIRRLRIQHQGAKLFRFATSEHRKNIRSATLMLVFVTCTYLGSNLLNVIVYTWELIDKESLMTDELRPFYTLSSDLVSLLTVLASACRLPIYIACNARIRCEVLDALNNCVLFRTENDEKDLQDLYNYNDEIAPPINKKGETRVRSIGTGLDRIVLSVAMGSMGAMGNRNLTVPSFGAGAQLLEEDQDT